MLPERCMAPMLFVCLRRERLIKLRFGTGLRGAPRNGALVAAGAAAVGHLRGQLVI